MIIDHKPNSGSPHLSTPNKSPSPSLHLPTPQQTAKPQQVHTHQSDESTTDTIKTETTPSDPLLAMAHQSSTPLMLLLQTSAMSFQLRGLLRFKSVNTTFFSMPITPTNKW